MCAHSQRLQSRGACLEEQMEGNGHIGGVGKGTSPRRQP